MFEAVLTLCAALDEAPCRDVLVPGYEAKTRAQCEAIAPAQTTCQAVGETLAFQEIIPGLFVHMGAIAHPDTDNRGAVSNLGFVIGADSVAVIDTGSAAWMGEATWRAIRARTDKPVSHVILTHMHPDHVLGASVFGQAGAEIVGDARLARALADRGANYLESLERLIGLPAFLGTEVPKVTVAIEHPMAIDLGGRVLTLQPWPTAHTGTDITVLDGGSATLFAGDLIFHRHTPALDGSLRGWQGVLEEMQDLNIARIIPGHGGPVLDWPDGGWAMISYLETLAHDTRQAIDRGERLGDAIEHIAASEAEQWELFDSYNPRNATVAFTELEWE